jgi:hypothetical protein
MPAQSPILALDTSSINRLTADPEFTVLMAGLKTGYYTRLNGSNIAEIAATQKAEKRGRLLDTCQRLLVQGDCIDPFAWIVEKQTKRFDSNPKDYDWKKVNVRNCVFEKEVRDRESLNDEMAQQEKASAEEAKKRFEDIFCSMRPGFDEIFSNGTERPETFADFVKVLQKPGGAFWTGYGHKFYARNVKDEPNEAKIRDFADRCPPFLMMILGAVMAQFKRAIVSTPPPKKRAGRVDLLMGIYLTYCRIFVTDDRDQVTCLRDMGAVGGLATEVLSYKEFRHRLLCIG